MTTTDQGRRRAGASRMTFAVTATVLGLVLGACASRGGAGAPPAAAGPAAQAGKPEHEHGGGHAMMHGHGHGGHEHMMMGGGMCPMKVPGATVSATDVEGGVAVAFTTSSGDVAELQRRVHHLADMHGHHQAQHQERMSHDPMNATATAEDIEGGTRIVLRPADASQLDELRRHAHAHAEMMAAHGDCPMQEGHAHGEERP